MTDALLQFRDAIRSTGLEPPDAIEPGTLHRFPGAGKALHGAWPHRVPRSRPRGADGVGELVARPRLRAALSCGLAGVPARPRAAPTAPAWRTPCSGRAR